jgi:hypothetical protein
MNFKDIKSFSDACKVLGLSEETLPEVSMLPEKHRKSIIAFYKLVTIIEAINNGWTPNWNDENQWKYYPWLGVEASEENPSGSGFSYSNFNYSVSYTKVGSRLCVDSREKANYLGEQFQDLYKDYLLY